MKIDLTKNIGLKILSVLAAFVLWLVVVNVDDPVISKTYTGISVELLNTDVLENQNKDYEVLDNSDSITVVVTAKRSVIDEMSKDYIRATADLKSLSNRDTVPIEVKSTRYSDRLDSVTTRSESVKLSIEDIISRTIPVTVEYTGSVAAGYVLAGVDADIDNVTVSGPQSMVENISSILAVADIEDIVKDAEISQELRLYGKDGKEIVSDKLIISKTTVGITVLVDMIKEIPIESGYSGTPAAGYIDTGSVIINPSSVFVSGRGENFSDLKSINIAPNEVSITDATDTVVRTIDITGFLPTGVSYYNEDEEIKVEVAVEVKPTERKTIQVPLANIRVENLPDGYIANVVDIGGAVDVEIQGLGDTFDRFYGERAEGIIDAANLVPRNVLPGMESMSVTTGENDGVVDFVLAPGITVTSPVSLLVIVDYVGITEYNLPDGQNIGEEAGQSTEGQTDTQNTVERESVNEVENEIQLPDVESLLPN